MYVSATLLAASRKNSPASLLYFEVCFSASLPAYASADIHILLIIEIHWRHSLSHNTGHKCCDGKYAAEYADYALIYFKGPDIDIRDIALFTQQVIFIFARC